MESESTPRRASRVRLYAPFVLLALVAAAWSAGWFVVRGRVVDGLDRWLKAEAASGRNWSCEDRHVEGFPFRIEVGCARLAFARPDLSAAAGRLGVVAQVYRPSHVIAELAGPLVVRSGATTVTTRWSLLRASVVADGGIVDRAAIVADGLSVRAVGPDGPDVAVSAARFEQHLRINPADQGAYDWASTATDAVVPGLDGLIGGTEPATIDIQITATQARGVGARPLPAELDRWRDAGGRLDVTRILVSKGTRRLQASGRLALDEARRPVGQVDLASANLEGSLGGLLGGRAGLAAGLLGALVTPRAGIAQDGAAPAAKPGEPPLRPFPTLRLEAGRLLLGPFAVPGVVLPPLY